MMTGSTAETFFSRAAVEHVSQNIVENSSYHCRWCEQAVDSWHAWDSNPLYAIMHESIYCQGGASAWAAERVRGEAPFAELFDAAARAEADLPVYFTGEMIFPWMFDEVCGRSVLIGAYLPEP